MNPKSRVTVQALLMNLAPTSYFIFPFVAWLPSLSPSSSSPPSLPSVSPRTSDWCEDHRGFSMDGWMHGSISKEDWSSNEGTWESRHGRRCWKLSEAKKSSETQATAICSLWILPSSQITVTHWFFLLPFPPISVMPSCHPVLFIAVSFHVFFFF